MESHVRRARRAVRRQRELVFEVLAHVSFKLLHLWSLRDVPALQNFGNLLGSLGSHENLEQGYRGVALSLRRDGHVFSVYHDVVSER